MFKIAIIESIHKDGLELLNNHPNFEYELIEDVSEKNLIKKLPDFDACTLRVSKLDEKILKSCSKLKAISRHGVGYDNVDLNYIKKNNITLLVTATANAVAVAEHVISMFLSLSKSISKYDKEVSKFKIKALKKIKGKLRLGFALDEKGNQFIPINQFELINSDKIIKDKNLLAFENIELYKNDSFEFEIKFSSEFNFAVGAY